MPRNSYIVLLDPSIQNEKLKYSNNLGDVIIFDSIDRILKDVFPNRKLVRLSTHASIPFSKIKLINNSYKTFIGGTNILSSEIESFSRMRVQPTRISLRFPLIKNIIPFGCGWAKYDRLPSKRTREYYNKIFSKKNYLSVRDSYSKLMLEHVPGIKVLNTCCPTTWNLYPTAHLRNETRRAQRKSCVFTLTDYNQNQSMDSLIIKKIIHYYTDRIFFFPQGSKDVSYISSLDVYKKNKNRIIMLPHQLDSYYSLLNSCNQEIEYVGTRLHGGIKAMQENIPSIIISIDNRTKEISKDIKLPCLDRININKLSEWIEGSLTFSKLDLPLKEIAKWKDQFTSC